LKQTNKPSSSKRSLLDQVREYHKSLSSQNQSLRMIVLRSLLHPSRIRKSIFRNKKRSRCTSQKEISTVIMAHMKKLQNRKKQRLKERADQHQPLLHHLRLHKNLQDRILLKIQKPRKRRRRKHKKSQKPRANLRSLCQILTLKQLIRSQGLRLEEDRQDKSQKLKWLKQF